MEAIAAPNSLKGSLPSPTRGYFSLSRRQRACTAAHQNEAGEQALQRPPAPAKPEHDPTYALSPPNAPSASHPVSQPSPASATRPAAAALPPLRSAHGSSSRVRTTCSTRWLCSSCAGSSVLFTTSSPTIDDLAKCAHLHYTVLLKVQTKATRDTHKPLFTASHAASPDVKELPNPACPKATLMRRRVSVSSDDSNAHSRPPH